MHDYSAPADDHGLHLGDVNDPPQGSTWVLFAGGWCPSLGKTADPVCESLGPLWQRICVCEEMKWNLLCAWDYLWKFLKLLLLGLGMFVALSHRPRPALEVGWEMEFFATCLLGKNLLEYIEDSLGQILFTKRNFFWPRQKSTRNTLEDFSAYKTWPNMCEDSASDKGTTVWECRHFVKG